MSNDPGFPAEMTNSEFIEALLFEGSSLLLSSLLGLKTFEMPITNLTRSGTLATFLYPTMV